MQGVTDQSGEKEVHTNWQAQGAHHFDYWYMVATELFQKLLYLEATIIDGYKFWGLMVCGVYYFYGMEQNIIDRYFAKGLEVKSFSMYVPTGKL